jgi:hypothetical protein
MGRQLGESLHDGRISGHLCFMKKLFYICFHDNIIQNQSSDETRPSWVDIRIRQITNGVDLRTIEQEGEEIHRDHRLCRTIFSAKRCKEGSRAIALQIHGLSALMSCRLLNVNPGN